MIRPCFRTVSPGDRIARRRIAALAVSLLAAWASPAYAIKIVQYNALNFANDTFTSGRYAAFKTVLSALNPDIVCLEEVTNQAGHDNFLNNVLNAAGGPGGFAAAPFIADSNFGQSLGANNSMYYRTSTVSFISAVNIPTEASGGLRDWSMYRVRLAGYTTAAGEMYLFVAHLSSSGGDAQRTLEATVYRNWAEANLPAGAQVVTLGDFNLQNSSEGAWTQFTQSAAANKGRVHDPLNLPGNWNNASAFALIHTQSPNLSAGGSYVGGGMDDRFDFILLSDNLQDGVAGRMDYRASTYRTFGNDGQHFNKNITDAPTIPEGAAVAMALYTASDHLPVVMELNAPAKMAATGSLSFGTVVVDATATRNLIVNNPALTPGMTLTYSLAAPSGYSAPSGSFTAAASAPGNSHVVSMLTASPGTRNATLVVTGDAPEQPSLNVMLTGNVLAHAVPSTVAASQVVSGTLDFGGHNVGGFTDQAAAVHNAGYTAQQAALNVHAANVTGDPRFSIVGFSATDVAAAPAAYTVHFNDAGASPGAYTGTLTFSTRDDPLLPGATNLASVAYSLSAAVTVALIRGDFNLTGCVDPADVAPFVALLLDPASASTADRDRGDMNADAHNDAADLAPFVTALLAGCP